MAISDRYFFAHDCRSCGMILHQTTCEICGMIWDEAGHWEYCRERQAQDASRCPSCGGRAPEHDPTKTAGRTEMECDYCEQKLHTAFCERCDGYFWEGHTATCAVPAMFPALEHHFQKCVQGTGFDPDEVIC